jgi:AcrR family transcriptional regulator
MNALSQQIRARHSRAESRSRIIEAATELVRTRSYAELSVGEVMERAGFGRTIFYRHFDDLADLLVRAGREAITELYEAQRSLGDAGEGPDLASVRAAMRAAAEVYHRHGPVLRAISEAAAADPLVAPNQAEVRRLFYGLAEEALRQSPNPPSDPTETARALNLMNEAYLLEAFGREPRVSVETAVQTLTEVWSGFFKS